MGRFWFHLIKNGQTDRKNSNDKNTKYSAKSKKWTLLNLDFTETSYVIELVFDQIDTALADKDKNFTIFLTTYAVY